MALLEWLSENGAAAIAILFAAASGAVSAFSVARSRRAEAAHARLEVTAARVEAEREASSVLAQNTFAEAFALSERTFEKARKLCAEDTAQLRERIASLEALIKRLQKELRKLRRRSNQ